MKFEQEMLDLLGVFFFFAQGNLIKLRDSIAGNFKRCRNSVRISTYVSVINCRCVHHERSTCLCSAVFIYEAMGTS